MVVRTQGKSSGQMVLHIGAGNVEQHFPRTEQLVELELDHLRIMCVLEPGFWLDRPEISDSRLSLWLDAKRTSGKFAGKAASLMMIPCGNQAFRLELKSNEPASALPKAVRFTAELAATAPARTGALTHGGEVSLPPRKAKSTPKMRKIGRLKGNDSLHDILSDRAASAAIH